MVEPGGVRDIITLKFLILYVLCYCKKPISQTMLNDILMYDGLVDFFEFATALPELVDTGHVIKTEINGLDYYQNTRLGDEAISLFQNRLKPNVRRKSIKTAQLFLENDRLTNQVKASYKPDPNGGFTVTLSYNEAFGEIFSLSINVATTKQAEAMCRRFQENTSEILEGIMKQLAP